MPNECGVPLVGCFNVHLRFVLSLVRASRSFATCAQDCTQLHILQIVPFFVDLPSKVGTATISPFTIFRYFFFLLPDDSFEFNKLCENLETDRGRNDVSHLMIFRYFFVFLTYQRGLPKSPSSPKSAKNRSVSSLYYFPLHLLLHHLAERPIKTHCPCIALKARIEFCSRADISFNGSFDAQFVLQDHALLT